jgi:hypothetical protein
MRSGAKIKAGMGRLSINAALLLVALLMSNAQCLARCTGEPCQRSATTKPNDTKKSPCHGHERDDQKAPSAPCQLTIFSAVEKPSFASTGMPQFGGQWILSFNDYAGPRLGVAEHIAFFRSRPFCSPELVFSTVLRI